MLYKLCIVRSGYAFLQAVRPLAERVYGRPTIWTCSTILWWLILSIQVFHLLPGIFHRCPSCCLVRRGVVTTLCTVHVLISAFSGCCLASLADTLFQLFDGAKQPVHHVIFVVDLCLVHCIVTRTVDKGDISPSVYEKLNALEMAIKRCPVEGGVARFVDGIQKAWARLLCAG